MLQQQAAGQGHARFTELNVCVLEKIQNGSCEALDKPRFFYCKWLWWRAWWKGRLLSFFSGQTLIWQVVNGASQTHALASIIHLFSFEMFSYVVNYSVVNFIEEGDHPPAYLDSKERQTNKEADTWQKPGRHAGEKTKRNIPKIYKVCGNPKKRLKCLIFDRIRKLFTKYTKYL